jgi:hypothetical protein
MNVVAPEQVIRDHGPGGIHDGDGAVEGEPLVQLEV